jgi:hypothetical protein
MAAGGDATPSGYLKLFTLSMQKIGPKKLRFL